MLENKWQLLPPHQFEIIGFIWICKNDHLGKIEKAGITIIETRLDAFGGLCCNIRGIFNRSNGAPGSGLSSSLQNEGADAPECKSRINLAIPIESRPYFVFSWTPYFARRRGRLHTRCGMWKSACAEDRSHSFQSFKCHGLRHYSVMDLCSFAKNPPSS